MVRDQFGFNNWVYGNVYIYIYQYKKGETHTNIKKKIRSEKLDSL
jgi:hypothetical protein